MDHDFERMRPNCGRFEPHLASTIGGELPVALLDAIDEPIYLVDHDETVLFANEAARLLADAASLDGRRLEDAMPAPDDVCSSAAPGPCRRTTGTCLWRVVTRPVVSGRGARWIVLHHRANDVELEGVADRERSAEALLREILADAPQLEDDAAVRHDLNLDQLRQLVDRHGEHDCRECDAVGRAEGVAHWHWVDGAFDVHFSVAAARVLGLDAVPAYLPARAVVRLLRPALRQALLRTASLTLQTGRPGSVELTLADAGTGCQRLRLTFERTFVDDQAALRGVCAPVEVRWRMVQQLQELASRDQLTRLPDRAALSSVLADAVERSRGTGLSAALLLLGLDSFKAVNDAFGHSLGDEVLRLVARRLRENVREHDVVARAGGDEFAIVAWPVRSTEGSETLARRLLDVMRLPFEVKGRSVTLGASIGIAQFPGDADDAESWLHNADQALKLVKTNGRDGARTFDRSCAIDTALSVDLVGDLRRAILAGELDVHYQPQWELSSGRLIGFEALARWVHPTRGPVSPVEFVAVAEQSRLIGELGRYVLNEACRQWRRFADLGCAHLTMAVNVSPAQLWHMDLVGEVEAALERVQMPPHTLVLEVTENVFLDHSSASVAKLMESLSACGVQLALDDFGTGFSSLSYLSVLPLNKLKIDRSFVDRADTDVSRLLLLKGIVALSHALKLETVAEGVEREEERALLLSMDCVLAQGYLFSRPLPASDAEAFVSERRGAEA